MRCFRAYDPSQPNLTSPMLKAASCSSKPLESGPSSVLAKRIAAAHSAQMEATMAVARADYDAKTAELMAELEKLRREKDETDTELAYLEASSQKERLQWSKDRTTLTRKVAEAVARAREAAGGLVSPRELLVWKQTMASQQTMIHDLRRALEVKEAQQGKLQFELACAATAEADVDRLTLRTASLEKELMQESEARIAAEQAVKALSTEVKILDRRLSAAREAVARAEEEVVSRFKDGATANAEVREAHAAERHNELWLEKSLAEVDAVTTVPMYEHSVANGVDGTCAGGATRSLDTPIHTPSRQQLLMPRPTFNRTNNNIDEVVMPKRIATSAVMVAATEGRSTTARKTPPSMPSNQISDPRTPNLDNTAPVSTVRMRSKVGAGGWCMGMVEEEAVEKAICPCVSLHRRGGIAGIDPERFDSETCTSFARVDQDKQWEKFLSIVRNARRRMQPFWALYGTRAGGFSCCWRRMRMVPSITVGSSRTTTSGIQKREQVSATSLPRAREATTAVARADCDAKTAELMAVLEKLRGKNNRADTELAYFKASSRRQRLRWSRERTTLTRKVAKAVARAREAAGGLVSPRELLAWKQTMASQQTTIHDLCRVLEVKEEQQGKLQFELACAATAEADVDRLMIRAASLEKELMQESEARIATEQAVKALSTEVKSLDRRLGAAREAIARAEE